MGARFLSTILGCRPKHPHKPNTSDGDSAQSVAIATEMLRALDLLEGSIRCPKCPDGSPGWHIPVSEGTSAGAGLEQAVAADLQRDLSALGPATPWVVGQGHDLGAFAQYRHLGDLARALQADETGLLAVAIGQDYLVRPDVTVGVRSESLGVILHASVSCKLTMRSDRAQNVRLEAAGLIRHRRGRLPHIVAVTAEPLPTRLTSLTRGTGDVDALYHVALPELQAAVARVGNAGQQRSLQEMVGQGRLLDYRDLASTLAST